MIPMLLELVLLRWDQWGVASAVAGRLGRAGLDELHFWLSLLHMGALMGNSRSLVALNAASRLVETKNTP